VAIDVPERVAGRDPADGASTPGPEVVAAAAFRRSAARSTPLPATSGRKQAQPSACTPHGIDVPGWLRAGDLVTGPAGRPQPATGSSATWVATSHQSRSRSWERLAGSSGASHGLSMMKCRFLTSRASHSAGCWNGRVLRAL
jgi:hypothetical protein